MSKILDTLRIAIKGEEKNFTTGSINRAIILLSIPMILEMVMESLFAIVDVFFVAQVSTEAVATVGLTESVMMIVYSLAVGMTMAITAMVARRVGEGKNEAASNAATQAIFIAIFISILFGILGIIFAEDILRLMGGSDALIASGLGYTQIMMGSNLVIMLLFLCNGIFRGAGDASLAMRVLWLSNGLNIILDPLFIFGIGPFPELGVTGAAVATTCGRGIGVLFQLYILFKGVGIIQLTQKHLEFQWNIIKKLANVALTGAGQWLIASASWIFLMRIVAEFGDEVVAGYTIAIRILIFTILPSWGMANAASTLVGQNLGAKQPDRAEKSVIRSAWFTTIFLTGLGILLFIFSEPVVAIFTQDISVQNAGVLSLQIICVGYIFFAPGMVISQAFNGAGDTRTPTVINLICFWCTEIPLAYFLSTSLAWGPAGVYWAIAGSEALLAIICILVFRQGKWKLTDI